MIPCDILHLGIVEYEESTHLQELMRQARLREEISDTLILLQHPPVFTIGRAGKESSLLAPQWMIDQEGIKVVNSDRGGDVTYHGPGQLVIYPILQLDNFGDDVHNYVRRLEQSAIDLLAEYGIVGGRNHGFPGVWTGVTKIAAIGISVRRGVTKHGMAINIDPNLTHFDMINPCGLGKSVTSMAQELRCSVDIAEVETRYVKCFANVFNINPSERLVESVTAYVEEISSLAKG